MFGKRQRRRRRRGLSDIGPNTARLATIRAGVRGTRRALERGSCRDATALLRHTEHEVTAMQRKFTHGIDDNTQFWLDVVRARVKESCKTGLGKRRRRRR